MTSFDWTTAIAESSTHLAGLGNLPPPAAHHPALQAITVLSLTAEARIDRALTPDSTIPILTVPRYTGRHDLVDDLLARLTADVASPARGSFPHTFSATNWLAEHGFDDLLLRSVQHTSDDTGRAALLAHAARRAHEHTKEAGRLRDLHMRALLERDTPDLHWQSHWHTFDPAVLAWLLAHEHDGDKTRALRVQRRLQALRLYTSLAERLRKPAITAVIDAGRELVPALAQGLGLTRAQLVTLREAALPHTLTSYRSHSFEHAVCHLQAHAVPLHQWPGGGKPGQPAAWAASPWLTTDEFTLVPADYFGSDPVTVRDAVRAFADDLLAPLLAELGSASSASTILDALAPNNLPAARAYLACIRRALIGPRRPKAFQQAVQVWHRRAAAAAALRNENQTDRPGWPPLCPPWTSPCGRYRIEPLTTAKALVEEGNAHPAAVAARKSCPCENAASGQ